MTSLPYYPFYPSDFEGKTSHLTLEEDGAYNRLLRLMWMTPGCSLPNDDAWLARRMRVDASTFARVVKPLIDEFFKVAGGRIIQPRLREEFEKADVTYRRRSEAGKKGGRPKALDNKGIDEKAGLSRGKAGPKQPEPEPEPEKKKEEPNGSSKNRGSRLTADWRLPKGWGEWAVSEGLAEADTRLEGEKFRDYWAGISGSKGVKLDWLATWRNWVRKAVADRQPKPGLRAIHGGKTQPARGDLKTTRDGRVLEWDGWTWECRNDLTAEAAANAV